MKVVLLKYLSDAGRTYHQLLAPAREAANLTQAELDILLFLANNPEYTTASDIVAVRRLAKSNVSVSVKNLEAKGLLLRHPDEKDRRVDHLSLAPASVPVVELGQRGQQMFMDQLYLGFSPEEQETLGNLLARIQHNLAQPVSLPE